MAGQKLIEAVKEGLTKVAAHHRGAWLVVKGSVLWFASLETGGVTMTPWVSRGKTVLYKFVT